jgi:hypothetical protein
LVLNSCGEIANWRMTHKASLTDFNSQRNMPLDLGPRWSDSRYQIYNPS